MGVENPGKSTEDFEDIIFWLFRLHYQEYELRVPEPLEHIVEVGVVAEEIVKASGQYILIEETKRKAFLHDVGRAVRVNGGIHPALGRAMARCLGVNDDMIRNHHVWGSRCARLKNTDDLKRLDFAEFATELGLPNCALIIADNSKAPAPGTRYNSVIAPFSFELGERQIAAQIARQRYEYGSPRHMQEQDGLQFLQRLIEIAQTVYGFSYDEAVHHAQMRWPAESASLQRKWTEMYSRAMSEKPAEIDTIVHFVNTVLPNKEKML